MSPKTKSYYVVVLLLLLIAPAAHALTVHVALGHAGNVTWDDENRTYLVIDDSWSLVYEDGNWVKKYAVGGYLGNGRRWDLIASGLTLNTTGVEEFEHNKARPYGEPDTLIRDPITGEQAVTFRRYLIDRTYYPMPKWGWDE